MWLTVTLSLDGGTTVKRSLEGSAERMNDLRPVWPSVVRTFQDIVAKAFDTEGASTASGAWDALERSTERDRVRHGYSAAHPILEREGTLRRALTIGEGANIRSDPQTLEIRLEPSIARVLNYHESREPRHTLPRRAPIDLTAADKHAMFRPIARYLSGSTDPDAFVRGSIRDGGL